MATDVRDVVAGAARATDRVLSQDVVEAGDTADVEFVVVEDRCPDIRAFSHRCIRTNRVNASSLFSRSMTRYARHDDKGVQMKWNSSCIAVFGATVLVSSAVHADDVVILATGRRDPRIYAIDLREALRPANNNTSNAIVSRSLVNPRRLDGTLLGDPANLVLSDDQRTAFVMNHHGGVTNREFLTRADGADARPKGTYVTPDGRFAVVTGGANTLPSPTPTGTVFIVDLAANRQVATVTGVGIDPYNLVVVDRAALGDGD